MCGRENNYGLKMVWYNNPESNPTGDINHDGVVNLSDLAEIARQWQKQN
jgi:hypothetical protein